MAFPKKARFVVIGAGIHGLSTAWHLAEKLKKKNGNGSNNDIVVLDKGDYLPPRGEEVSKILKADEDITHVVAVHCETSSGILNPIEEISDATYKAGRKLLVDSMSAFGAIPIEPNKNVMAGPLSNPKVISDNVTKISSPS